MGLFLAVAGDGPFFADWIEGPQITQIYTDYV
jgi:hypothetical protein